MTQGDVQGVAAPASNAQLTVQSAASHTKLISAVSPLTPVVPTNAKLNAVGSTVGPLAPVGPVFPVLLEAPGVCISGSLSSGGGVVWLVDGMVQATRQKHITTGSRREHMREVYSTGWCECAEMKEVGTFFLMLGNCYFTSSRSSAALTKPWK